MLIVDGMANPDFRIGDYPAMASMRQLEPRDYCGGEAPETFYCTLRLLGLSEVPRRIRPVAEALGAGLQVEEGDLWLRASWYHTDRFGQPDRQVEAPAGEISFVDPFTAYDLGQGHLLIRYRGATGLADRIRLPKPFLPHEGVRDLLPQGDEELRTMIAGCSRPGCRLIAWDVGVKGELPQPEWQALLISAEKVLLGMGKLLGWETLTDPQLTGGTDTDLGLLLQLILRAADSGERVVAHVNGADQASHRLDPEGKHAFLQRLDRELIAPLLRSHHPLLLTSDHGSDPLTGHHLPGPQPRLISFPTMR